MVAMILKLFVIVLKGVRSSEDLVRFVSLKAKQQSVRDLKINVLLQFPSNHYIIPSYQVSTDMSSSMT